MHYIYTSVNIEDWRQGGENGAMGMRSHGFIEDNVMAGASGEDQPCYHHYPRACSRSTRVDCLWRHWKKLLSGSCGARDQGGRQFEEELEDFHLA